MALTERFIEVMESEHREIGLGDPALGQTVRKLVGSLARRVELWRSAMGGEDWRKTARSSVFGDTLPGKDALNHVAGDLRALWIRIEAMPDAAIIEGRIG